jgi:hypothetical protein
MNKIKILFCNFKLKLKPPSQVVYTSNSEFLTKLHMKLCSSNNYVRVEGKPKRTFCKIETSLLKYNNTDS